MAANAQEYWDERYRSGGLIWGMRPSATAAHALQLCREHGVRTLLVPGSGYGRNTSVFSSAGLAVTGIEVSAVACAIAPRHDPLTHVHQGDATSAILPEAPFDAAYCFNVLHLFRAAERERFVAWAESQVVAGGLLYFVVFSEREATFGQGEESEPGTFESKPGRPIHYFTDSDLREHFHGCRVIETGLIDEEENHDGAPHVHRLRYIVAETPTGA